MSDPRGPVPPGSRFVVTSILEDSPAAVARLLAEVPERSGLVEIRADRLRADDVAGLVARADRPVLITARPVRHGGGFDGSEEERRRVLERGLAAGAALVDVEWDTALRELASGAERARVVLSHHGSACTTEALGELYTAMASVPAGRLKIVPRAESVSEIAAVVRLLERARSERRELTAFASGRAGLASRILALRWGGWGTYGASASGRETAEGQPKASDLIGVWNVLDLDGDARIFALVGEPVVESPSPAMHATGYREHGLRACYIPVETGDLDAVLAPGGLAEVLGCRALAVTIPLKEAAAARARPGDEHVVASGAANTLVLGPGRPVAYNTDASAALALIRERLDPRGLAAAVVGAGGTGRSLAAALRDAGAEVTIYNRDEVRAACVGAGLGVAWKPWSALAAARWDLLVQATPLGRRGETVVPGTSLVGRLVLDAAYGTEPTPLVGDARARGLAVFDGVELLAAQAARQFEIMTGRPAQVAAFLAAARARLGHPIA